MPVNLDPYLHFSDRTREAMEFYRSVLGGELTMTTFGEAGMSDDPAERDKVMHAQLVSDADLRIMASDAPPGMPAPSGAAMSMSLSGDDEATLRRYWDALVDGGTVSLPLEPAPWGDVFGMCTDRFGVPWMVDIVGAAAPAR